MFSFYGYDIMDNVYEISYRFFLYCHCESAFQAMGVVSILSSQDFIFAVLTAISNISVLPLLRIVRKVHQRHDKSASEGKYKSTADNAKAVSKF